MRGEAKNSVNREKESRKLANLEASACKHFHPLLYLSYFNCRRHQSFSPGSDGKKVFFAKDYSVRCFKPLFANFTLIGMVISLFCSRKPKKVSYGAQKLEDFSARCLNQLSFTTLSGRVLVCRPSMKTVFLF